MDRFVRAWENNTTYRHREAPNVRRKLKPSHHVSKHSGFDLRGEKPVSPQVSFECTASHIKVTLNRVRSDPIERQVKVRLSSVLGKGPM
jgi:hypothetical protein